MVATARSTSSGVPQRSMGVNSSARSLSKRALATSVLGVRISPGRTSQTAIPCAASRTAKSFAIIATDAFDMAYPPRCGNAIAAFENETNAIDRAPPQLGFDLEHPAAHRLREEEGATRVHRERPAPIGRQISTELRTGTHVHVFSSIRAKDIVI